MTPESARRPASRLTTGLRRTAVPPAVALALAAGLAGCKGVVVATSTPGDSITATAASGTTAANLTPAASAAGTEAATPVGGTTANASPSQAQGPGSVSASVTSPVTVSGTVTVPVSCVSGLAYRATVNSAVVHGDQLSFSLAIARYRGPGSYPSAVVGVTLRQASGVVTTVAGVSRIPAVITSTGGSFLVSATGSDGRTLSGSLSWTCGA